MNMTRDKIKTLALANGFTERQQADGSMDLNGYVYAFAEAIYADGQRAMRDRAARHCDNFSLAVSDSEWANGYATALKDAACGILAMEVKPS